MILSKKLRGLHAVSCLGIGLYCFKKSSNSFLVFNILNPL